MADAPDAPWASGITADDPEGDPPYPVHPKILDLVAGPDPDLTAEFLDFFYEGYLVYDETTDSVIITHKGRKFVEDYLAAGGDAGSR